MGIIIKMAPIQTISLMLAALAITGCLSITCYHCDIYDEGCNSTDYHGSVDNCDDCTTCLTRVFHAGNVERWVSTEPHSNGDCYYGSLYNTCYCDTDRCNNNLCEARDFGPHDKSA